MKKRLRFFITTLNTGGAERVLMNLLAWLDPEKYEVSLFAVRGGDNEGLIPANVKYRSLLKDGKLSGLLQRFILKLPDGVFASLFLKGDFDYEIAYLEGKPTAYILAKKTDAKKVAFIHYDLSVKSVDLPMYCNPESCLAAYRRFYDVCFVSKDALKGFEKTFGFLENGRVIHNVIDSDAILNGAAQPVDREYKSRGLKLVAVGRLVYQKNFEMLISVVSELSREYDFELWIIGDGEKRQILTELIEGYGVDNIHLLGNLKNPFPYVKKADLFVCSSRFEGYSTAVLESIILGIPVLTTNCAGMHELLDDGKYGVIVDNSPEGLKDGLRKFATDPGALELYRKNLSEFSVDSLPFAQEYRELFS